MRRGHDNPNQVAPRPTGYDRSRGDGLAVAATGPGSRRATLSPRDYVSPRDDVSDELYPGVKAPRAPEVVRRCARPSGASANRHHPGAGEGSRADQTAGEGSRADQNETT